MQNMFSINQLKEKSFITKIKENTFKIWNSLHLLISLNIVFSVSTIVISYFVLFSFILNEELGIIKYFDIID